MSNLKISPAKPSPDKMHTDTVMTTEDKLLLTLIRLRRGLTYKELAYFFRISCCFVSKMFIHSVYVPSLQKIKKYAPK